MAEEATYRARLHRARLHRATWACGYAAMFAICYSGCDRSQPLSSDRVSPAAQLDSAPEMLIDVTELAGIDFVHDPARTNEYLFPEITGAGCGFLDYDNDGYLDIYLVQSGRGLGTPNTPRDGNETGAQNSSNRLYRNRGDGTFEDVTVQSGSGDTGYGQGLACADFNRDGYVDIYVANVGGPSVLLKNNGDGTFSDVTKNAGVGNGRWAIAPAFFDYDDDGWPDLLATNYVDWSPSGNLIGRSKNGQPDYVGPRSFSALSAILFRNNGDGTFSDVTIEAGLDAAFGAAMGVVCADFDDDDRVDVFVANDSWPNQLWHNQGDGTFVDIGLEHGCALSGTGLGQASMGTNVEDLDGDGKLDLFTTNYHDQGSILYLQGDNGIFMDVSMRVGLFRPTAARTGFGACFFDLHNDGQYCVYIGNGAAVAGGEIDATDSYSQTDMVLSWSQETKKFSDISKQIGAAMDVAHTSRGVAVGDYDNDGAVDVLISNNEGPARLLRNQAATGNWLMVRCLDANGKSDVVGAKVYVTVDGKTRRRDVVLNYSYASVCDPRIHFGIGPNSRVHRVRVRWPGGLESELLDVEANQVVEMRRPVR